MSVVSLFFEISEHGYRTSDSEALRTVNQQRRRIDPGKPQQIENQAVASAKYKGHLPFQADH